MATDDELASLRAEVAELRARLARAEAAASPQNAALFDAIIEHGSDAILVAGRDGRHVYANESAERLLGYTREELLALSITDLIEPAELRVSPADTGAVPSGVGVRNDRTLRRKDASLVRVDASARRIGDGIVAIVRDISERVAMEQSLRESETKYRNLFEHAQVGMFRTKADGSGVAELNARFCEIVGTTREDALQRPPIGWWASGSRRDEMIALLRKNGRIEGFQGSMINAKGERIEVLASATLYPDGYYEGSIIDVTEKKRADEELLASLREKEVLLREIHHRVKNNLQIITSLLYLQSTSQDDSRLEDLLRVSMNRIASMALVHQKLYESENLSRIPFERYVHDLAHSLYRSYGVDPRRVGLRASADSVVLSVGIAVPCGLILNELVSNALKHAFPGSTTGQISIELTQIGDRYHLRTSDDGIGLPRDLEQRAQSTLGLKLVGQLAEQLGGALERESTGRGTSYRIVFPRDAGT